MRTKKTEKLNTELQLKNKKEPLLDLTVYLTRYLEDKEYETEVIDAIKQMTSLSLEMKNPMDMKGMLHDSLLDLLEQSGSKQIKQAAYKKFPESERLFVAAAFGWKKTITHLSKKDIDPNTPANTGETALYLAAKHGHLDAVEALLKAGANVNPPHVLSDLITANKDQALRARVNSIVNLGNTAPLYAATVGQHHEVMKLLLRNGADVHQLSPYGIALESKNYKANEILIPKLHDWKTSVNCRTLCSSIHFAAKNNDVAALEILTEHGAKVDESVLFIDEESLFCIPTKNKALRSSTPLCIAIQYGSIEAARYLIAKGANVNHLACDNLTYVNNVGDFDDYNIGITPLQLAAMSGNNDVVNLLLDSGADINKESRSSWDYLPYYHLLADSPIEYAVNKELTETARLFIQRGASLKNWSTYMYSATRNGDVATLSLLLEHQNRSGQKQKLDLYLEIATLKNDIPAVSLLLEHGAKVQETQIERAKDSRYKELYKILKTGQEQQTEAQSHSVRHRFFNPFSLCLPRGSDTNQQVSVSALP